MSSRPLKAIIPMADYGHDPTETAVPFTRWTQSGIAVTIATETGKIPQCDTLMLQGTTQKLLGATSSVVSMYRDMEKHPAMLNPVSWSDPTFNLDDYDIVFLPGGHDKGMQQIIDSSSLQTHLSKFWPKTKRSKPGDNNNNNDTKTERPTNVVAAICHGVMVLSRTPVSPSSSDSSSSSKSVLHDVCTTTLPSTMESTAHHLTRLFLGSYYKTYGVDAPSTEASVRSVLNDEKRQWKSSLNPASPFVVEDEGYWYFSGRFPGDAELLSKKVAGAFGVVVKS